MFVILTILVLLGGIISLGGQKIAKKRYVILMCVALTFVSGFRSFKVGTDTPGYVKAFSNAPSFSIGTIWDCLQEREPLYYIFQSFIRSLTDSYTVFFVIIAIFFIACIGFFIYKYSKMP